MVKFCPHDLFVNTRADVGPCSKTHDEEAKKLFQDAKNGHFRKIQYQENFVRFCSSMINEVEKKIIKGRQRLALSGKNVLAVTNPQQAEKNQEQIEILNERINELEKEAEQAGTGGNVQQAQGLMKLCDQLKEKRGALKKAEFGQLNLTTQLAVEQEKQMEVCEVCGAFLIVLRLFYSPECPGIRLPCSILSCLRLVRVETVRNNHKMFLSSLSSI
ncbi:unnamed protein product [Ceutorhynchus assimilis]|uniref:Luc7-like protein 3 n=1 Tax=Ceutorhynchus assimilis TaxID=467358 RepID=A0A9N9MSU7_9CUCU|nr:unnamed protein product [Ceutorhynchus assimilis]